jgi:hypothetical protein
MNDFDKWYLRIICTLLAAWAAWFTVANRDEVTKLHTEVQTVKKTVEAGMGFPHPIREKINESK